jgi:2-polyprenyl-3-methyl-5-hydroxy-6-metoxy-1,4-benzoquinol methylase
METSNASLLDRHCPICGGVLARSFLDKNGYTIAICMTCGVLYVSPMPTDEALQAHYQNLAYFKGEEEQGYRNYADMKKALLPHFTRRLHTINKCMSSRGRLLDFGCAAGYFLEVAKTDGWQIAGVELSQDMANNAARALNISVATSLDTLLERDFDVLTMWEVIEHLSRPVVELARLRDRMRPGGMLMLSTPNTGHWQAMGEPNSWIAYRPPSHLLYFTKQTLEDTLQRAGFERITIHKVSPLPPMPRWLSRISKPLQQSLANGKARPWLLLLLTWRIIRVLAWAWQKAVYPHDDVFTTLEAIGFRPAE